MIGEKWFLFEYARERQGALQAQERGKIEALREKARTVFEEARQLIEQSSKAFEKELEEDIAQGRPRDLPKELGNKKFKERLAYARAHDLYREIRTEEVKASNLELEHRIRELSKILTQAI